MQKRTENHPQQCTERTWCDVPGPIHVGQHDGEADLPKITATAHREDFVAHDEGVVVPEVFARLQERGDSNTFDRYAIALSIVRPDGLYATCHLTLKEADLLAQSLGQLLSETAGDRMAGLR